MITLGFNLVTILICYYLINRVNIKIREDVAYLHTNTCCSNIDQLIEALRYHANLIDKIICDIDLLASEGQVKPITRVINPNIKIDPLPITDHGIVVGKTKSGKTNLLFSQIIRKINSGQEVRIIDVKKEIGPIFRNHATIIDGKDAVAEFQNIVKLAEERQELFAEASNEYKKPVTNIEKYRQVTGRSLPDITLVVEELLYLKECGIDESSLIKALVICRSAGIWILVAVQLLRQDVLSRKGSINFGYRAFQGPYDRWAFDTLFPSADDEFKNKARQFLGQAGKAVISIDDNYSVETIPYIEDEVLEEWMN